MTRTDTDTKNLLLVFCYSLALFCSLGYGGIPRPNAEPAKLFEIDGNILDAVSNHKLLVVLLKETRANEPNLIFYTLDNAKPQIISRFTITEHAQSLAIHSSAHNTLLLVAAGSSGLIIIDISTPSKPKTLSALVLEGFSHKAVATDQLVLMASGFYGLQIIDISSPDKPQLLSSYQLYPPLTEADYLASEDSSSGMVSSLFDEQGKSSNEAANDVLPNDLYLGEEADDDAPYFGNQVEMIPFAELERREGATDIALSSTVNNKISKKVAYLAYSSAGIVAVDYSNPYEPIKLAEIALQFPVESIATTGHTLLFNVGLQGVFFYDIKQPSEPKLLSNVRTNCYPMAITAYKDAAYIADGYCGSNGLLRVDIHDRKQPILQNIPSLGLNRVRSGDYHLLTIGKHNLTAYPLATD